MKKQYKSAELEVVKLCPCEDIAALVSGSDGGFYDDDKNWADGPIPPRK